MRLWSIDFRYLDRVGLVALWREALLARAVLLGQTRGYRSHPQLKRFLLANNPVNSIDMYINHIYQEAKRRGYNFDPSKVNFKATHPPIPLRKGQIVYEFNHLMEKLRNRDFSRYQELLKETEVKSCKIFAIIEGGIEPWEKLKL